MVIEYPTINNRHHHGHGHHQLVVTSVPEAAANVDGSLSSVTGFP